MGKKRATDSDCEALVSLHSAKILADAAAVIGVDPDTLSLTTYASNGNDTCSSDMDVSGK
ncbi:hypothetical protein M1146_06025 [Patescibacteria group bacterium]|nr:hypothetical protein [Patescibacteria group bacterium]